LQVKESRARLLANVSKPPAKTLVGPGVFSNEESFWRRTVITRSNARKNTKMQEKKNFTHHVLTVQEVSDLLKIPASTIYDLAKKGKLRGVKLGKHWRFLEEDILALLRGILQ